MSKNKKGFTIIEVVLVLAIAGLIFLMVFIALPALQRSQRNTQREDDLSRLLTAANDYQTNNNGKTPFKIDGTTAKVDTKFVKRYVDEAYSATTDKRPQFQEMISDSCNKEFDIGVGAVGLPVGVPDGKCWRIRKEREYAFCQDCGECYGKNTDVCKGVVQVFVRVFGEWRFSRFVQR